MVNLFQQKLRRKNRISQANPLRKWDVVALRRYLKYVFKKFHTHFCKLFSSTKH